MRHATAEASPDVGWAGDGPEPSDHALIQRVLYHLPLSYQLKPPAAQLDGPPSIRMRCGSNWMGAV